MNEIQPKISIDDMIDGALGHHQAGRIDQAAAIYREVLDLDAGNVDANHLLGVVLLQSGNHSEAADFFITTVRLKPDFAEAHCNLGVAFYGLGRLIEAASSYNRALAINPAYPQAHYNLGNVLRDQEECDQAVACYRKAIELKPDYIEAHNNLGFTLQRQGQLSEAIASLNNALSLNPDDGGALVNLGNSYLQLRNLKQAEQSFRQALDVNADEAEAHNGLGNVLKARDQLDEAVASYRKAIEIIPEFIEAHNNLGNVFKDQGKEDASIECFKRALDMNPDYAMAFSNLLFTMTGSAAYGPADIWAEIEHWNQLRAPAVSSRPANHRNDKTPGRRLTIGYVSPDFRRHSVSYFFEPLLSAHDRDAVKAICYAEVSDPDEMTGRLQELSDGWCQTVGRTARDIAQQIQRDGVDILVDLAGHTKGNRLDVFALKPAPLQITWLGYPGSTGLGAMNCRLTDAIADPEGVSDPYFSEDLIRLNRGFHCYKPPSDCPEVSTLPARESGAITFGSFNNLGKVTSEVISAWARILTEVPGSRMVIKSPKHIENMRARCRQAFSEHGIGQDRLELLADAPTTRDHLETYGRVDIALDTFPYNGTTTTCEALWMGVPVVTLRADRTAGRIGASLLTEVGMPDLITDNVDAYVAKAKDLAGRLDSLDAMRASMRQRMARSPLCDPVGFAEDMEATYRQLWRQWCETP